MKEAVVFSYLIDVGFVFILKYQAKSNGVKGWASVLLDQRIEVIGGEESDTSEANFTPKAIAEVVQVGTNWLFVFFPSGTFQFSVYKFASST